MGNKIYFAKYDEPKQWQDPIFPKYKGEKTGEWVCDSPLVERVWFTAMHSNIEGEPLRLMLHLVFKDGCREDFTTSEQGEDIQEKLIQQAEEFISTYSKENETNNG